MQPSAAMYSVAASIFVIVSKVSAIDQDYSYYDREFNDQNV